MTTDSFDVNEAVKSAIPQMVADMKERLAKNINSHAERVAVEECTKAVKQWVQEQMVPEIIAQLNVNKQDMIDKAKAVANVIGDGFAAMLKLKIEENLKSGYNVNDIVSKLLKGY